MEEVSLDEIVTLVFAGLDVDFEVPREKNEQPGPHPSAFFCVVPLGEDLGLYNPSG